MVRIYGSGVPGGDVSDDAFAIRESKARDAARDAACDAAQGAGGEAANGPARGAARGSGSNAAHGAGKGIAGATAREDVVAAMEEFRAQAVSKFGDNVFGDEFAHVVAIKADSHVGIGSHAGTGSHAQSQDIAGNGFLAGVAGEALRKSLESLGYDPESVFGIDVGDGKLNAHAVRQLVELVDPAVVVAMDARSSQLLVEAFAPDALHVPSDEAMMVMGRRHVFLHDFEGSLDDIDAKRRAWAAIRTLKRRE